MRHLRALFIDLEGTLYFKGKQIPGAQTAIEELDRMGIQLRFLTNTDSKSTRNIHTYLRDMHLFVPEGAIFSAADAALEFLESHGAKRCHCLLSDELASTFAPYIGKRGPVDYVVIGDVQQVVSYDALDMAFRYIMSGAEILALQKGRYFVREDGYHLDTGAFVQLFEYASGKAARVLGKPSPGFFGAVMKQVGCAPTEVAVVGDDITTDLIGAKASGAWGILVRTGKFSCEALQESVVQPDVVVPSIAELPLALTRG